MATRAGSKAGTIEEKITKGIAAAGVRLRFDRVALRLLEEVKAQVGQSLPADQSILFTVTAPIKHPGKTSVALQEWLPKLPSHRSSTTIHGNEIHARLLSNVRSDLPRVMGFVHNPEKNADLLLDIAATRLRDSRQDRRD